MLKKTIKYTDPMNDKEYEQEFYFNLTAAEVAEIHLMDEITAVSTSTDSRRIIPTFKKIIKAAIGERVGNQFEKSDSYANWFIASNAYSELFLEIFNSSTPEADVVSFIKAMLPVDMVRSIDEQTNQQALPAPSE